MQPPSIAIIGAGPGGLTTANILHRQGWQVSIFEADASATARDQGGTLDLHPHDGQLALKKAGLLEAFMAEARHEDQGQRVVDHATGAVLQEEIPEPGTGDCPEIDRMALRQLLLRPLPAEMVRWDAKLEEIIARPDGKYDLLLNGDVAGPFDLVIGADGAWSRVRAALSDVRPVYSGIAFVELWFGDVDAKHPAIAELVGHGTTFSLHNGTGLFAQRNGGNTIRVYAAFRTTPEETDRPDKALAGITKGQVLTRFTEWAPAMQALIAEADRIAAIRPIMGLPSDQLRWEPKRGLTLLGDAAHVMPPLGVGVNLAMLDAAELAEALLAGQDWWAAVQSYEAVMLERSTQTSIECNQGFAEWFGEDGLQAAMDIYAALQPNAAGAD